MDISKSLQRVKRLFLGDSNAICVRLKYEKLSNFCYCCDKLSYRGMDCDLWVVNRVIYERDGFSYGA